MNVKIQGLFSDVNVRLSRFGTIFNSFQRYFKQCFQEKNWVYQEFNLRFKAEKNVYTTNYGTALLSYR